MERPEKPGAEASAEEIYRYFMEYEEYQQFQGAKKVAEMNAEREAEGDDTNR